MNIKVKSLGELKAIVDTLNQDLQDLTNLFGLHRQQILASAAADKIANSYSVLTELNELMDTATSAFTTASLQFKDDPKTADTLEQIKQLRGKIARQYNEVLSFLTDVAIKTVPDGFRSYVESVASTVATQVNSDYKIFHCLSVLDRHLLYSAYVRIQATNDNGEKVLLYLILQQLVGDEDAKSEKRISIAYRLGRALPDVFAESTLVVSNEKEAIAQFDALLRAEDILVDEGTPVGELQQLNLSILSLKDKLDKVTVSPESVEVQILPNVPTEQLDEVRQQIYLGIQRMFNPASKLQMHTDGLTMTFDIMYLAPKTFESDDVQYFKTWGLTDSQIKKMQTILS